MLKFVVLMLLVCQVVQSQSGRRTRSCTSDYNCYIGECCSRNYMIASRRDLSRDTRVLPYDQGYCKPYSARGEDCSGIVSCGCAPGLRCVNQQSASSASFGARFIAGTYRCVTDTRYWG